MSEAVTAEQAAQELHDALEVTDVLLSAMRVAMLASRLVRALAAAEQRLAAAEQQHSDVRAALLAYTRAHGNVAQLSNDMVEVEMFKCFLRAVSVLGIVAKPPTPPATVTREQRKRTLDDVDRAIQQDGDYT